MVEQGRMASDRYGDDFLARIMPKKRVRNRFFVRCPVRMSAGLSLLTSSPIFENFSCNPVEKMSG